MPATGNEAVRLSQLKSWWDTTIATINASINNKLDKPGTAATAGQVLSNNGTQNVWIDAPGGDSYVLPPASEESLGGVTLATGKAGHSGVVGNGADELIVQNPVGKTSGVVMVVDDAYPTKPLGLKVHGNTRQNLWMNPSGTKVGVSVTANDDGSITFNGTSTSSNTTYFNTEPTYIIEPNTQYTLSVNEATVGYSLAVRCNDAEGSALQTSQVNEATTQLTFTTPEGVASALFFISVPAGQTVSGTCRIMLNEGSEPKPWCPPGLNSVSELECVFEDDGEQPNVNTIPIDLQGNELCSLPDGTRDVLDVVAGTIAKSVGYIESYSIEDVGDDYIASALTDTGEIAQGAQVVYKLPEQQEVQLAEVPLPALPSPNITAYASANVEAESEMEYVQLLNVVLSKLRQLKNGFMHE